MKNFIIAFCVFLVWSFFGLWLYYWLQGDNSFSQSSHNEVMIASDSLANTITRGGELIPEKNVDTLHDFVEATTGTALHAYTLAGDILFRYENGFTIEKNSDEVTISESAKDFKYKLNTYYLEHPNSEIQITSQYSAEENTSNPNLGIQRGKQIKQLLVSIGIPEHSIIIKPHITPINFASNGTYKNAFSFLFQPLNETRLKRDIPETKTIYPRFSSSGILKNVALETLLAEVKTALEENKNLTVEVIGHTDNVGNAEDNYQRGLDFAREVRWYLVAKGPIDKNRVKASSKGESEAIASNQTEKGRMLNQRIEIRYTE